MAALAVPHLPNLDIGMIDRQVGAGGKAQPEQAAGAVERRLHHVVEDEVRLHLGLVEIVSSLPDLLGVVAPIPHFDRLVQPLGAGGGLQSGALLACLVLGRRPHLPQQMLDRRVGLGHRIIEPVGGEVRVAEEPCLLGAQRHDLADQGRVVGRPRMGSARGPRLVRGAAQIAAGRKGQKRLDRRAREADDVSPAEAALFGRVRRGGANKIGQAVEIGRVEHQPPFALVVQHVLAEQGVQRRQPLGERRHARLLVGAEQRAVAHKAQMVAFEKT